MAQRAQKPPVPSKARKVTLTKAQVGAVVNNATESVAKKMGVHAEKLPASVKTAIQTATQSALDARLNTVIQRDVDRAVKGKILAGAKPIALLDERMELAKEGVGHIAKDDKVKDILDDTARLLFTKFTALKEAGFNEEQAFELLRSEVSGRAGRNR